MILDTGNNAKWVPIVLINEVDVSARLTGHISINAAENSARVASLSLIPASSDDLVTYDNQVIKISVTLSRTGATSETYLLFTGVVESHVFSAFNRIAELSCRDYWYEYRDTFSDPDALDVQFSGVDVYPCRNLLPWNETEPNPSDYFDGLLATTCASAFIDSTGTWQTVAWDIGTPSVTFDEGDIDDGSMVVTASKYSELPYSVTSTLIHRQHRLHCAEVDMTWDRVDRSLYISKGLPTLPKSTVQAALDGISDWWIKGSPVITEPIPGSYPIVISGETVYYLVSYEQAQVTCDSLDATLYRRWYQSLDVKYYNEFIIGGESDSINLNETLKSDFDANEWENPKRLDSSNGLYVENAPTPVTPPTGYESLPGPYPDTNSAIDYIGDQTTDDIQEALNYVNAKGLRMAAEAKRKQTVRFSRPVDPRFEIGDVIGFDAYGVSGKGQVVEINYDMDIDTGDATSQFTLAVPDGDGAATGFTASVDVPVPDVTHAFSLITLGNQIGSSYDTSDTPDEDSLIGFLCNVDILSDDYDSTAPRYNTQFRVILPEIAAEFRDPIIVYVDATSDYTIADGGLVIDF